MVDNDLKFLEIDLRQLLLVKLATKRLPQAVFEELQQNLQRLCRHLDNIVNPSYIEVDTCDALSVDPNQNTLRVEAYPRLKALCWYLSSNIADKTPGFPTLDLVASPKSSPEGITALFLVPPGSSAQGVLEATEACNATLRTLFQDQGNGYVRLANPQKSHPAATAFGERAVAVLEALVRHYAACERDSHDEVLLSLSDSLEAANGSSPAPILDLLLPDCSKQDSPHEAQCLPYQRLVVYIVPFVRNVTEQQWRLINR
jgi:hypothetical protein